MSLHSELYKLIIGNSLLIDAPALKSLGLVCKLFSEYVYELYPTILRRGLCLTSFDQSTDLILEIQKTTNIPEWNRKFMRLIGTNHDGLRLSVHLFIGMGFQALIRMGKWYVNLRLCPYEGDFFIYEVRYKDELMPVKSARGMLNIAHAIYPEVPELLTIRE